MRILYICDKLITFILNEIIELKERNNDILILSEHSKRGHDVINKPILIKNGLDRNYYRFSTFKNRKQKYFHFFKKLIYDFFVHPALTVKALLHILKNYPSPKYGIVDYLDVRGLIDSGIDIIHSPFSTPRVIDKVYLLSKILNVPFTLCFRAHDIYHQNNLHELIKRVDVIKKAAHIITIADYNKKHIKNNIDLGKDIEIIHSAINTNIFTSKDRTRPHKSIVSVCRLSDEKGINYLLEACYILSKRKIDYDCTIIGEGPEKKNYEKLIDELKIPGINFIDYLPYNKINEHLNNSTVFVLPCVIAPDGKRDILANALKEAMAMQVPVITSKICGIEELVDDGINGILVPPRNPEAIADAVEKIFSQPGHGRKMGEEGRKKIEKDFNIKIEAMKLEKIFKKVLNHNSKDCKDKEEKTVFEVVEEDENLLPGGGVELSREKRVSQQ